RCGRLPYERIANALRLALDRDIHVVYEIDRRRADLDRRESSLELHRRGLHQAGMEWGADRKRQRPLRAAHLAGLDASRYRFLVARNHDLTRRIEVDGFDHAAGGGFGA